MNIGIAGTTGLIGKELLELLSYDKRIHKVYSFQRRSTGIEYTKVELIEKHFDSLSPDDFDVPIDAFVCTLGTTMKKAKTRDNFRKVDFDYVVNIARMAHQKGCKRFAVVSAMGANAKSVFFYNRVKGEMELALMNIGFERLDIYQPSLLLGNRRENRPLEKISEYLFLFLNLILIGSLANYAAIKAKTVAKSISRNLHKSQSGIFIHKGIEMKWVE